MVILKFSKISTCQGGAKVFIVCLAIVVILQLVRAELILIAAGGIGDYPSAQFLGCDFAHENVWGLAPLKPTGGASVGIELILGGSFEIFRT